MGSYSYDTKVSALSTRCYSGGICNVLYDVDMSNTGNCIIGHSRVSWRYMSI